MLEETENAAAKAAVKVLKQQHQTQLEEVISSLQTSAVTANR